MNDYVGSTLPIKRAGEAKPQGDKAWLHGSERATTFASQEYPRLFVSEAPVATDTNRPKRYRRLLGDLRRAIASQDTSGRGPECELPAGYTYFGQMLAHDVSYFRGPAMNIVNGATARLDLDGVYGGGLRTAPFLFAKSGRFLTGGCLSPLTSKMVPTAKPDSGASQGVLDQHALRSCLQQGVPDLLRTYAGHAIIPDLRNDENMILSQIHLALQLAHNELVDQEERSGAGHAHALVAYDNAHQRLLDRYHYVVVNDYLPRVLHPDIVADAKHGLLALKTSPEAWASDKCRLLNSTAGRIPAEFAFAAFRFGHSMIRADYNLNETVGRPVKLLLGFRPLPDRWQINWELFFDKSNPRFNAARPIHVPEYDDVISVSSALAPHVQDGETKVNMAMVTLTRAEQLGLASGQVIARWLSDRFGVPCPQIPASAPTPLWPYVLAEAELHGHGPTLGPTGSRLVFEVLGGLLARDDTSYLHRDPGFLPDGNADYGVFDLLKTGWAPPPAA